MKSDLPSHELQSRQVALPADVGLIAMPCLGR